MLGWKSREYQYGRVKMSRYYGILSKQYEFLRRKSMECHKKLKCNVMYKSIKV